MVKDIMLDLKERDLLFVDKSDSSLPAFEVVWGTLLAGDSNSVLYCNIIIPADYITHTTFDNDECLIKFAAPYKADTRNITIRLVEYQNSAYSLLDGFVEYVTETKASHLPLVDLDFSYLAVLKSDGTAKIYSSKQTDLLVDFSDDQSAHLLMSCIPGSNYRFPTTGVGIARYLNTVVEHTDLLEILKAQFEADKKPLTDAYFDSATGEFNLSFIPEKEEPDEDLEPISSLDTEFFQQFTD